MKSARCILRVMQSKETMITVVFTANPKYFALNHYSFSMSKLWTHLVVIPGKVSMSAARCVFPTLPTLPCSCDHHGDLIPQIVFQTILQRRNDATPTQTQVWYFSIRFLATFKRYLQLFNFFFNTFTKLYYGVCGKERPSKEGVQYGSAHAWELSQGYYFSENHWKFVLIPMARSARSCRCHWWQWGLHRRALLFCYGICEAWLRYGAFYLIISGRCETNCSISPTSFANPAQQPSSRPTPPI